MMHQSPIDRQWRDLLSRHDLTWSAVAADWGQGAFIGNGMIGAMIYKDSPNVYRWELGRCDVLAHFQFPMVDWADPRVPIGDMLLKPNGTIQSETMRLNLWDAEVVGTITTDLGTIQWRSIAHADDMVFVIETETTGGETGAAVSFRPRHGISPCLQYPHAKKNLQKYGFDDEYIESHLPEKPYQEKTGDIEITTQAFLTGGECVTACKQVKAAPNHILTYVSIENSYPKRTAKAKAVANVEDACRTDIDKWLQAHRQWWHNYYQLSFLSCSDTFWEGFYWIQMYKLACATRADRAVIDSQGPWLTKTPWPTCVWNLNVQLSYWPVYTSNRLELGESLTRTLNRNMAQLILNVPDSFRGDCAAIGRATSCVELRAATGVGWELGNLTWVCHNYYRHYRCSMDDAMLKNHLYPLLRRAINFYLQLMEKREDGRFHLPLSHSPEYGAHLRTRDANYDLALFRWGCQTLLSICEHLKLQDELMPRWREVLENLTDRPADGYVLRIGRDFAYEMSHRHFSHLFAFYPLHLLNPSNPEERKMMEQSMNHWLSIDGNLLGYTWTVAALMSATLGDGEAALAYLNRLKEFLTSNTMYVENGPVIETPLSAAESIHNMLLQSWEDVIRVFPAVPSKWKDVSFRNLRAEGAFLVSAVRKNGTTHFVRIESLAGRPCRVATDIEGAIRIHSEDKIDHAMLENGIVELSLAKGQSAILYTGSEVPEISFPLVSPRNRYCNYFGMQKEDMEIQGKRGNAS